MSSPPPAADARIALFLDVDGTLIDFTDTPSATLSNPEVNSLLAALAGRLDGAVSLVSGRAIQTLDALFAPLRLPSAGLHGVERRDAHGVLHGADERDAGLDRLRDEVAILARRFPGTLIEDKERSIGVHYRLAPESASEVHAAALLAAASLAPDYEVQEGLMLVEVKPRGVSKGTAVDAFMTEVPFEGRRPVFIGDDLTDLHGFGAVERQGGYSIGVGSRVAGTYHLADVAAVRRWLGALAYG